MNDYLNSAQNGRENEFNEPLSNDTSAGLVPVTEKEYAVTETVEGQTAEKSSGTNTGIALALGIASILFCRRLLVSAACGIAAIVMGLNEKKASGDSIGNAAFICGIAGLALCVIALIFRVLRLAVYLFRFLPFLRQF